MFKLNKTRAKAALATGVALVVAAVMVDWKSTSVKAVTSELVWKMSAVFTLLGSWMGDSAHTGMQYLNQNSLGISALVGILGLIANIYYMRKQANKVVDKEEE